MSIFRQFDSLVVEEVEGDGQMREPDRQLSARYVLYIHLGLVRGNGGIYDVIKKGPEDEFLRTGCLRSCDCKKQNKTKGSFHSLLPTSKRDDHTRIGSHSSTHTHIHKSVFYSTQKKECEKTWKKYFD